MAEFPPGGEFRRFRRLLALTVPVARGLSPFLFHRCLTRKVVRQAVTPDQQAIFIFHFIIGKRRHKVNPRPPFFDCGKNQVLNAHNFSLLVLSNFDKPTQPPSCPMVGSLCIFLFSSPCSALLTPSPYECPLCWFLPVTRSVRSLAGTPGT